jgi:hypothetical protein
MNQFKIFFTIIIEKERIFHEIMHILLKKIMGTNDPFINYVRMIFFLSRKP